MVDAQAVVLLPGAGLIIPERVLAGRVGDGAQRVRQPEAEQRTGSFSRVAGRNSASLTQAAGLWTSRGGRDDVEIARQHQRLLRLKALAVNTQEAATSI